MSQTHLAAILAQKGGPLTIEKRNTPEPGSGEILIEVQAVALNPVDYYQRDFGMQVPVYPAVLGSDTAGTVVKVGSDVPSSLIPGTRVIALASSFYQNGLPDYGAFQKLALAQAEAVIPLPEKLSFEQGAVLPLGVMTALTAWTSIGIPLDTKFSAKDKQAVLIWGGASSVGTFAIQSARVLGFTVYATASAKHHEYLKKLGAHVVFDYKDTDVVGKVVEAVKRDGLSLTTAHCVVDNCLQPTLEILKQTKDNAPAKVAHSPLLPEDHPTLENTEIKFNFPPMEKGMRDKHIHDCFHVWLQEALRAGTIVPSPQIEAQSGGLEGVNAGLDRLKAGVSGIKIVVPL
ncbi:quinone reductase [Paraphoma chrysanthemicola]|nr:quinone reductase [Paraphoma chrysanthemicola]